MVQDGTSVANNVECAENRLGFLPWTWDLGCLCMSIKLPNGLYLCKMQKVFEGA